MLFGNDLGELAAVSRKDHRELWRVKISERLWGQIVPVGPLRLAFSNQYCQPWARQQENFLLGVPPEVARAMPPRLQEMLGYSIHPPFMGQLTASHPAKALQAGYVNPVREQAGAAGAPLPEQAAE